MIEIVRPGLLDLVMDLGRPGFRAMGVPEGGAADVLALRLANRLVGNSDDAAGLELLLQGPVLRFPAGARIALAGAEMGARLNGTAVEICKILEIQPGGLLELGIAGKGLRAYLAVDGGIDVPVLLGGRSTFLPGGFGGWQGRALKAGDVLPVGDSTNSLKHTFTEQGQQGPFRILPGPQLAGFDDSALHALTLGEYTVSPDSNRLGLRLTGQTLKYAGGELASQAVLPGAIQVPPEGQPIILGWDGPVTGGYPVVAGIIAADLFRLAQLRPGDKIGFRFVGLEEAQAAAMRVKEAIA